jgi:hypothetical protein
MGGFGIRRRELSSAIRNQSYEATLACCHVEGILKREYLIPLALNPLMVGGVV